jgi:hypothetical protein
MCVNHKFTPINITSINQFQFDDILMLLTWLHLVIVVACYLLQTYFVNVIVEFLLSHTFVTKVFVDFCYECSMDTREDGLMMVIVYVIASSSFPLTLPLSLIVSCYQITVVFMFALLLLLFFICYYFLFTLSFYNNFLDFPPITISLDREKKLIPFVLF